MVEITDRESLEAWLNALPGDEEEQRKIAIKIAHRAAMRVLPIAWREFELADWARRRNLTAMPILRSSFVSGVATKSPTLHLRHIVPAASAVAATVVVAGSVAAGSVAAATVAVASGVLGDVTAALTAATQSAAAAVAVGTEGGGAEDSVYIDAAALIGAMGIYRSNDVWRQVVLDCQSIETDVDLMLLPLWYDRKDPFSGVWADLTGKMLSSDESNHWQFWIDWYERALRGDPQDWEGLLTDVALIEDAVWEQGLAAVDERISIFQEKHELLDQIRELKAERAQAQATLAHRSHNMPPELVDAPPALRSSFADIWDQVEAAEAELAVEIPDPSRLLAIGQRLLSACKEVLAYCAEKADVAITKAAEEVGASGAKWAMRTGAAYWVLSTQPAQTIAERLIELAQRLP